MNDRDSRAGLPRRLAAMLYDSLLLLAVLFLATLLLLPFMPGRVVEPGNIPYILYLAAVAWLYFAWHWTHGGQTLGMRAWRLRLRRIGGGDVSLKDASVRFVCSLVSWIPGGAGYLWAIFDPGRLALHDRLSGTVLELTDSGNSG
jgi:uncharacterized RDD family membrane protein YckC